MIEEFNKNGVTHVVYLPDSETNWMYQLMEADNSHGPHPVSREGESIAIAAGLIAGGKKPVVLIQNTGMLESGDSIRGIGQDCNMPVVMLIGYRGWTRHGPTPDSAARYTEPTLRAWNVPTTLSSMTKTPVASPPPSRTPRRPGCRLPSLWATSTTASTGNRARERND